MKKFNFLFSLFLFLTLGLGQIWAADQTVTWTASSGALGSGIGSGTISTESFSWNYTRTLVSGASYTGWSSNYIQLGKNGGVENLTLTTSNIPGTIKSVTVNCASYQGKHNVAISVGNTTYLSSTAVPTWSNNSGSDKTGTGTSSGAITISFTGGTRALYIKSISVTYNNDDAGGQGGGDDPQPGGGDDPEPSGDETAGDGVIYFGSGTGSTRINAASVKGIDSRNKTWTISTEGTTSFTQNASYSQVGASSSPATSITFTTTLSEAMSVTNFSAKFGGFSSTAGTVTLKVGETTVGSGSLSGTTDVTVSNTKSANGTVLTVTVTDIAKGVKAYYIMYTLAQSAPAPLVADPEISGTDNFYPSTEVTITCETDGAEVYYTTDASKKDNPSTSTWSAYDSNKKPTLSATETVYAAAKKGDSWSSVTSKAFTKATPLSTMDAIFAAASTTGNQLITFSNTWVVTGVSTNGKTAYLTDGTKGLILFNNSASVESPVAGLSKDKTLSGTVTRNLTLYGGAAELTDFTADGLTIVDGTTPNVNVLDAEGIAALSAVNTGSLIKISGQCIQDGTKYYIKYGNGDNDKVQVYNTLFDFGSLTANANYECTGVYVQYNAIKEIAPRSSADIVQEVVKTQPETQWNATAKTVRMGEATTGWWSTSSDGDKSFSSSNTSVATITSAGVITLVTPGTTTLTFSTAETETYYAGNASLTLTVKAALPAGGTEFSWDATTQSYSDQTEIATVTSAPNPIISFANTGSNAPKWYNNGNAVRFYKDNSITITAPENKLLYQIEINFVSSYVKTLTTNVETYNVDGTVGTWSGLAKEVVFSNGDGAARITSINVIYAEGTVTTLSIDNITLQTTDEPFTINPSCNVTPMPAIVYSNYNSDYITIDDGKITPKAEGTTTVTASIAQGSNYSAVSTSFTVAVADKEIPALSFAQESYTAALGTTFTAPELTNPKKVAVEYSSSETGVATVNASTGAIELVGEGTTTITAAFAGNGDYAANSAFYTLNVADPYKDYFTADYIGVASTQYGDWELDTFGSGITYSGNSAKNGTNIQIRSDKSTSGIVSTTTLGYVRSVVISSMQADRTLDVYGSNNAYTNPTDLYGDNKGTLIGSLTSESLSLSITDNYKYVGLRSHSGAIQLSDITIKWEPVTFQKYTVTYEAGDATGDDVVFDNIEDGTPITLQDNPYTYEGHVFAGWSDGENIYQAGDDYTVNGDVTFTAQWAEQFNVTYNPGEAGGDAIVRTVAAGAYNLEAGSIFTYAGHAFDGWLKDETKYNAGASYPISENVAFTAQWVEAPDPVTVTFVAGTDKSETMSLIKDGISLSYEASSGTFNRDDDYRCYSGKTLTIASEVGNITNIEFTLTQYTFTTETGTYENGSWNGSAESIVFTTSGGQVRMTQISVTYIPNGNVPKTEAGLVYTTTEFTITVGDNFETPILTNPYDVPVTYSGNNSKLATVNAETGALTFVDGAAGEITVTATFEGNDQYYAGHASYTLVVNEPSDNVNGSWKRTAAVEDGMRIIIAEHTDGSSIATMGKDKGNNRAAVSTSSVSDNVLTPGFGTNVFTLIAQGDDKYAIRASNGNYLCAASSSDNYLKEKAVLDDNCKWTISISDGKATITAQGSYNRNIIRYNSSSSLFSCYASGQQDIAIYSKNAKMEADANVSTFDDYADLKVSADKTLTVTTTKQLGEVRLEDGAIINTDDANASLTVENFYFKTTNGKSNQFTDPTKFNVTGDFFYDVKLYNKANEIDADYWYSIAVPFDVDINNGIYNADGKKLTNGTDYEVWGYDTEKRAQTMSNGWKRISGKMQAGHAYLIGFNSGMTSTVRLKAANTWKTSLFSASSMSMTAASNDADDQGRHSNWNGVANPTLHYIGIDQDVQVFDNDGHSFSTFASDTYDFVVGTAFFVQGTADVDIQDAEHGSLRAPAREGNKYVYSVRITRGDKAKFDNQIVIRASEDASNTYEQGHDMMTMNNATAPTALLWTENYGGTRLAVEEAPIVNNSASYVLGIYAPADDEYTLSVAEDMSNVSLYLTRNGSIIWDLSASPITLTLNKGTNTGYGLIMQARAPQVVTGTENVENSLNAQKILFNEHVYILRDGQLYDVTGKLAK